MVSIISVSLDYLGDPVAKDRTFRQNTVSYPDLTSEAAERNIISMGGGVVNGGKRMVAYFPEFEIRYDEGDAYFTVSGANQDEFKKHH